MRYEGFRIENFKGIKDATIDLDTVSAAIFPLVGLNESGKTTILEAIHSFSPDQATKELVGESGALSPLLSDSVPRHIISSFTGDIRITATLSLSENEVGRKEAYIRGDKLRIKFIDEPSELVFERHHHFENGDAKGGFLTLLTPMLVRLDDEVEWRSPTKQESDKVGNAFYVLTPDIAYFPTFVFDFPKTIRLSGSEEKTDVFYKRVLQDILDYDGQGLKVEEHISSRVREPSLLVPWANFATIFPEHENRPKIQHVIDRASAVVTKVVFGRWNRMFGEDASGKEVSIVFDVAQGFETDASGARKPVNRHDVVIRFQIKEGTRRFDVNDRSLGFRWFFAFMLFTQFRAARNALRPMLFLFDEPASNLHAAAQQKLIDSFSSIVKGDHTLIYTTHSHHMIEPKWLEQTFVVSNRSDMASANVLSDLSLDDESLDVKATRYRSFIERHPNKTSYFQPVLDRLDVVPSRFDIMKKSIVVEGKSDYYIIRYASAILGRKELPLLPGVGAGTLGALASLHVGWNLDFIFILDNDKQGRNEMKRYIDEYGIPQKSIMTLDALRPGTKMIEDLFDQDALKIIQQSLQISDKPKKGQILRFCQEKLATDSVISLGAAFTAAATELLEAIAVRLS